MKSGIEIHFVSGKGGVGKSTFALAMAMAFAKKKRKTLLVELASESFFQDALQKPVSAEPKRHLENLDLAVWNGNSCLREYALHLLKSETLYKLFLENSVSKTLIQVAPGLAELAILGKITSGPPRNVGPKLNYDVLVVDAFSSGHFMALLKAPIGFAETIRFGPMGEQSRSIIQIIQDPKICHYHLVTLPEELPTAETQELRQQIEDLLPVKVNILMNRWLDISSSLNRPPEFQKYLSELDTRQKEAESQLKSKSTRLPWVLSSNFQKICEVVSGEVHV